MSHTDVRRRLLTLLCAVAIVGCSGSGDRVALAVGASVVALGDSLTYGTGAAPEASYPAVLSEISGWQVQNAGVPGETAREACARLPELLAEHRPALVLVLVGGNDFLRRLPDNGVREALTACVSHANDAAVPVVLMPVPRLGLGGLGDAPLYRESAKALGVPIVDAGLADLLATREMRSDTVHLNADGYRAMARRVADGLVKLGWLRGG